MNSIIVESRDAKKREDYIAKIINDNHISPFDITNIDTGASIGVEIVRTVQKTAFLTPAKGEKKAIIINNAQTLTIEAQNAFLKLLEEPPLHAIIILSISTSKNILPTILSRCSIISIPNHKEFSEQKKQTIETTLTNLFTTSISEKFYIAQTYGKDKATAIEWLEDTIVVLHEKLIHTQNLSSASVYCHILTYLQQSLSTMQQTNINPRFILEHLFLEL